MNFDLIPENVKNLTCAMTLSECETIESGANGVNSFISYGIHPLYYSYFTDTNISYMEELCSSGKIKAIGECGFDLYDKENRAYIDLQKKIWEVQLNLANSYGLPIIIHDRKGLELIMSYKKELRKLKSVVFHSFAYTHNEACSLLKNGINAYFSFGGTLLRNSRKAIDSITNIDISRILLETDAPYQVVPPQGIYGVYKKASDILVTNIDDLGPILESNFNSVLGI